MLHTFLFCALLAAASGCNYLPDTQYEALKTLYYATDGPNWRYSKSIFVPWQFPANETYSASPCVDAWEGITCVCDPGNNTLERPYTISNLTLEGYSLSGSIPSSLGYLTGLIELDLSNNFDLRGSVPESIGELRLLESLKIYYTRIDGSLPYEIGDLLQLKRLNLNGNLLNGSIPSSIGYLSKLQYLNLSFNSIAGTIPTSVGNLKSLLAISLESNNITGSLPSTLINLSAVQEISIGNNYISGIVPTFICEVTSIELLRLGFNQLSGTIPSCLSNLLNIVYLDLNNNNLNGTIPDSLGYLSQLEYLYLRRNSLSGTIPSTFSKLQSLIYLNLYNNNLNGSLPFFLGEISTLERIYLSNNNLTGSIPSSFQNLKSLKQLYLDNNHLTGDINTICDLTELTILELSNNRLSGTIPMCLSNLKNLFNLVLDENKLHGTIPDSLGDVISLVFLYVYSNSLVGTIPTTLGSLYLQELDLSSNMLTGTIPSNLFGFKFSNLNVLYLDYNMLTGSIPNTICEEEALTIVYLSSNHLNGTINDCFGKQRLLNKLGLDNNQFYGTIPSSLESLSLLTYLDLNNNQLIGTIPSTLGNLASIRGLYMGNNSLTGEIPSSLGFASTLLYLGLYNNQLRGSIPSSFSSLTMLEKLYLSENELNGTLPTWLGNLKNLQGLYLNSNKFHGEIPSNLGNIAGLSYLILNNNFLTGTIPSSLGYLNLTNLYLSSNILRGTIPSTFGLMKYLQQFQINNNALTGAFFEIFSSKNTSVIEAYDLKNLDISNNLFSGSLTLSFSKFPKLISISIESNCFRGSIPVSICDASNTLTYVILGVAGGNRQCRLNKLLNGEITKLVSTKSVFSNLGLSGTIPACLFSSQSIVDLRLSGNRLSGTLSDIANPQSSALSTLALNNNRLRGTIPASIQTYPFKSLILSNNRLQGTLLDSFVVSPNQTELGLAVNRLSGPLPKSLTSQNNAVLLNINKLNILATNLFSCTSDIPPDIYQASYSCGSYNLNISYILFLTAVGLLVLTFLASVMINSKTENIYLKRVVNMREKALNWYSLAWRKNIPNELKGFLVSLYFVRYFSILLTVLSVVVLLPIYLGLNISESKSSTVTYQYGYVVTISFLHGSGIVIFMSIFLFIILMGFRLSTAVLTSIYSDFFDNMKKPIIIYSHSSFYTAFIYAQILLYHIFNLVVTVAVNSAYVESILSNNIIGQSEFVALQVTISLFKAGWSATYIPFATKRLRKFINTSNAIQSRYVMSVVNFIVAPCVATLVANQSCFYYVFNQPQSIPVTSAFLQLNCVEDLTNRKSLTFKDTVTCNILSTYSTASSVYPPFRYSYACGSALLITYIPVFIYVYVFIGFAIPFARLCFSLSSKWSNMILSGLFIGFHPDHVRGPNILVDIMIHMTVLLTFGLAAPILCIEITMVVAIICFVSVSLTGRISQIRPSNLAASEVVKTPINEGSLEYRPSRPLSSKQWQVLEGLDIKDSWRTVLACADLIVITVVTFWALLFYDMVADENSFTDGVISSSIIDVVMCILIIGGSKLFLRHIKRFDFVRKRAMSSLLFKELAFRPVDQPAATLNDDVMSESSLDTGSEVKRADDELPTSEL